MDDINVLYKIYVLKDILNNVKYVGITKQNLVTRLNKHYNNIKNGKDKNKHKVNWFNKNFGKISIECIEEVYGQKLGFEREIYWISKYRSIGIDLINKTSGGEGCCGYRHSEETLYKMRGINNHNFGKKHTIEWIEEAKKRIPHNKGVKTNKPAHNRGVSPSKETIYKNRIVRLGTKHTPESIEKIRINCKSYLKFKKIEGLINNEWMIFNSVKEASVMLKLSPQKISSVCTGNRKTTGGIFFRYFESENYFRVQEKPGRKGNKVSVEIDNVVTIYSSITEAYTLLNISRSSFLRMVKGEVVNKYIEYKINII